MLELPRSDGSHGALIRSRRVVTSGASIRPRHGIRKALNDVFASAPQRNAARSTRLATCATTFLKNAARTFVGRCAMPTRARARRRQDDARPADYMARTQRRGRRGGELTRGSRRNAQCPAPRLTLDALRTFTAKLDKRKTCAGRHNQHPCELGHGPNPVPLGESVAQRIQVQRA